MFFSSGVPIGVSSDDRAALKAGFTAAVAAINAYLLMQNIGHVVVALAWSVVEATARFPRYF